MDPYYADDLVTLFHGDCLDVLRELPDNSVDAVATDPPYGLEFMGREWDGADGFRRSLNRNDVGRDNAFGRTSRTSPEYRAGALFQEWCQAWTAECLRVLKPGGHLLAFGGTRTWHRLAVAVEDAGFEIRDSIAWLYGQGFAKSLNLDNLKSSPFCRCQMGESEHGDDRLRGVREGVSDLPAHSPQSEVPDVLPAVQREGARSGVGEVRSGSAEDARSLRGQVRAGQPSLEGRGDVQAAEGELRRPEVRPLPTGVPTDGPEGRLHHGASSRDGSVGRSDADATGVREPHQPEPEGQPQGEPGAVPDQRGSQAWGGWPVCERCSQPVIPAGLGTALKPAFEPVVVARKPLAGTVAQTVLEHGTGALNIDASRIAHASEADLATSLAKNPGRDDSVTSGVYGAGRPQQSVNTAGRWPANVVLDESQADALDQQSGESVSPPAGSVTRTKAQKSDSLENATPDRVVMNGHGDSGGASRFFFVTPDDPECICPPPWNGEVVRNPYCKDHDDPTTPIDDLASRFMYVAKADASERVRVNGTAHPTVKPLALMRWLVRLVTPPGGTVLEPFAGSGTTVEAAILEGFNVIAIEREAEYLPLIESRIARRRDPVKAIELAGEDGGLFDLLDGGADDAA